MKLKYRFAVRPIDGHHVAVAVGKDNAAFRGMIRLNGTGGFIFNMLLNETTAEDIVHGLCREYGIDETEAIDSVNEFICGLKERGLIED